MIHDFTRDGLVLLVCARCEWPVQATQRKRKIYCKPCRAAVKRNRHRDGRIRRAMRWPRQYPDRFRGMGEFTVRESGQEGRW